MKFIEWNLLFFSNRLEFFLEAKMTKFCPNTLWAVLCSQGSHARLKRQLWDC